MQAQSVTQSLVEANKTRQRVGECIHTEPRTSKLVNLNEFQCLSNHCLINSFISMRRAASYSSRNPSLAKSLAFRPASSSTSLTEETQPRRQESAQSVSQCAKGMEKNPQHGHVVDIPSLPQQREHTHTYTAKKWATRHREHTHTYTEKNGQHDISS